MIKNLLDFISYLYGKNLNYINIEKSKMHKCFFLNAWAMYLFIHLLLNKSYNKCIISFYIIVCCVVVIIFRYIVYAPTF